MAGMERQLVPFSGSYGHLDLRLNDAAGNRRVEHAVLIRLAVDQCLVEVHRLGLLAVYADGVSRWTSGIFVNTPPYDLTLADGSEDHGTVVFTLGGNAATQAMKDDVVTVSVTPDEGYSAKDVTVRAYSTWEAAGARRRAPGR